MLHHTADAEDAVQDALLKAMKAYDRYDSSRPFKSWFFRILKNCCMDRLRQRARDQHHSYEADASRSEQESSGIERSQEIEWCLDQLGLAHQDILRLRYFADMSYADMADYLKIPKGTVMSRLHTARLAFAEKMELNSD